MIDCHTHAYPAFGERMDRALDLLSPDAGFIVRDALEDVRGVMGGLARRARSLAARVPAFTPLDIERVATAALRVPGPIWKRVEAAVSLGLMPQIALNGNLDRLIASMDETGIERALLIAAAPLATNAWVLGEAWPRARSRFIPVAMLPDLPAEASEREWADAFESLVKSGARGFKIHPNMDVLSPDHASYRAMFEVAQQTARFVVLHTGRFNVVGQKKPGPADPAAFEPLFREYPSVRVCLAHMNREHPEAAWELMRAHEQLFADTSWQTVDSVKAALKEVGARRILLGSDWPLLHAGLQSNALDILRRAASDVEFERVVKYTPLVFLGEA